jgi:hypothetical protein
MTDAELEQIFQRKKKAVQAWEDLASTKAWRREQRWESGEMHAKWAMGLGIFAVLMSILSALLRMYGNVT